MIALPGQRGLVVLFALDTLFASSAIKGAVLERVAKAQRARIHDIVLIASHTPFAPALDLGRRKAGKVDKAYFELAAHRVAEALCALVEGGAQANTTDASQISLDAQRLAPRREGIRLPFRPPFICYGINSGSSHRQRRAARHWRHRGQGRARLRVLGRLALHATPPGPRLHDQPEKRYFVLDAYYDDPLIAAAEPYWRSAEWSEVRGITGAGMDARSISAPAEESPAMRWRRLYSFVAERG
jgi:hypothetical protein